MDHKLSIKKIWPVIGLLVSMVLFYNHLQTSSLAASSKTMKFKLSRLSKVLSGFTRGGKARQLLASSALLPPIPLKNKRRKFHLYSIVPVRSQETFKGASLAIIGRTEYVSNKPATARDTFGKHFVKYNDNSDHQIFKIRKYTKYLNGGPKKVGLETTWYAEMPDEIAQKMFNPNTAQACTNVTVLMGEQEAVAKAVAEYQVCHNPLVLPQPENKVDTAYCINTPPFFSSETDYKEGKLSAGLAHVVPNILYHLHSGVDLFVIYVPASIRQIYLKLLEPVIQRYGHRLVFVDLGVMWGGIRFMPYINSKRENRSGKDIRNYDLQRPLGQDCLNRLKGHAHFFRTIDIDEYDMMFFHSKGSRKYNPKPLTFTQPVSQVNSMRIKNLTLAWNDESYKMPYITHSMLKLRSEVFDCLYLNNIWFVHEGMEDEQILPNAKTYIPFHAGGKGKCLCRPERIAVAWVHHPTNCFGRQCNVKLINIPEHNATNDNDTNNGSKIEDKTKLMELGYAHIRHVYMAHHPDTIKSKRDRGLLIDTSLFNEVLKEIEDELVDLYGTNVPTDLLKALKLSQRTVIN